MQNKQLKASIQQGFTLIELMVALLIGIVLLGATTSIFQTSAKFRNKVLNMSELQEESFFISHTLRQQLAQVSFRPVDLNNLDGRLIPVADIKTAFPNVENSWESGQGFKIDKNTLSYRFLGASDIDGNPDKSIYNCHGEPVGFGLFQETELSLENNQLVCKIGTDVEVLVGDAKGIIVEQLEYQIGVDADGDNRIDKLITPDQAGVDDFINAKSLTVSILLATPDHIVNYNQKYRFKGEEIQSSDQRLRMEAVVSVAIRN